MAGIAFAHLMRFWLFDDSPTHEFVAGSAVFIYGFAAVMAAWGPLKWARLIAVVFPVVGVSLVLVTGNSVDHWQTAVGVTQFTAVAYVVYSWVKEARASS